MRHESTIDEEVQVGLKFAHRVGSGANAPLLVMVHGRAGDRYVMWTFERIVPPSWNVVAFQAFEPDPIGGWSWWQMTESGSRRPFIHQAARRLDRAIRSFCEARGLVPSKRVAIGFSQGGVLVSTGAFEGILEFDAIGVLAGFIVLPHEPRPLKVTPRIFVAHGSKDDVIPVERARAGVEALQTLGVEVQYVEEPLKHKVGIQGTRSLASWLAALS
jgi:phospholipase/carboxylesterase